MEEILNILLPYNYVPTDLLKDITRYFKTISPASAWCAVGISRWIEGVHKMFKTAGNRYCRTS